MRNPVRWVVYICGLLLGDVILYAIIKSFWLTLLSYVVYIPLWFIVSAIISSAYKKAVGSES
jgi:type IV secretory pathway TrbL component